MADNRYGGDDRREGRRNRDSSIFSDDRDDRWSRGSGRWSGDQVQGGGSGRGDRDDRGFFERAGDEVRSWFGDNEAERRRDTDTRNNQDRGNSGGADYGSQQDQDGAGQHSWRSSAQGQEYRRSPYGGQQDYERSSRSGLGSLVGDNPEREQMAPRSRGSSGSGAHSEQGGQSGFSQGGFQRPQGQGAFDPSQKEGRTDRADQDQTGGRADWDDNYRRWRQQQLQQFDSEYEDYCRERQQQFEQDFDSWRNSRLTQGGTGSGFGTPGESGQESRPEQIVQAPDQASGKSSAQNLGSSTGFGTSAGQQGDSPGSPSAGSISSAGGSASATTSSTGSTGAEAEQSGRPRSRTRS